MAEDLYDWEDKKDDTPFKVHMIAGCVAGIAEHICMLPFDNVKVNNNRINNQI